MPNRRSIVVSGSLLLAIVITAHVASGADLLDYERSIRTTDGYLKALLRDGVAASAALSTLVARLRQSDVVVYLVRDHALPGHLDAF